MTFLPKSAWRYAVLIVILFAIVAVASNSIITYLEKNIPDSKYEQTIRQMSVGIWTMTMGVLFLAGALGLWAIRFSVEIESRLRIGRFVDAMDYLSDGLLALDKSGKIMGSNPSVKQLAPRVIPERVTVTFQEIFPFLTAQDQDCLLRSGQPYEVERASVYPHGLRTLRFRSQPSEGVILVIISDVTDKRSQDIRQKQIAQLQLVGRIASGVAYDFNNILSAISGHSALLQRFDLDPDAMEKSVDAISNETKKGALLSRQLLDLSRSGGEGNPSENLDENVKEASELLRVALSPEWTVKTMIEGKYPAVPLTPAQVVQVVLNLGLLAADAQVRPGTVMITLNSPGQGHLLDVGTQFVAIILISAEIPALDDALKNKKVLKEILPVRDETGVITSVVRSLVEEADGRMDHLTEPDAGLCVYRVCLPHLAIDRTGVQDNVLDASELTDHVAHWKILLAGSSHELDVLKNQLSGIGTTVEKKDDIGSILAWMQSVNDLDVVILDKQVLGLDADNLLQAILKLSPQLGIVVLCQDPEQEPRDLRSALVYEQYSASPQKVIQAMVDAKELKTGSGSQAET